ncbi:MAG: phosphotransferase [Pseudomonadota bacterium]
MVKLPEAVEENLHFLSAEIEGQLRALHDYFESADEKIAARLLTRSGYSDNLRARVQSACLRAYGRKPGSSNRGMILRSADMVARNLDLISRLSRRSVTHASGIDHMELLRPEACAKAVAVVLENTRRAMPALQAGDSRTATRIGQASEKIEARYDQLFRTYTRDMRKTKHTEDLALSLLVAAEVRRMGEALRGIGEAIVSANIGQDVTFERFATLQQVLDPKGRGGARLTLEPLAETRSGSAISGVRSKGAKSDAFDAVFKDGDADKVKEERAGMKSWQSIYPGLAPRVLSYEKRGGSAALLIEHLPGQTFEHLLLGQDSDLLAAAQARLSKTLRDIWKQTRSDDPAQMGAMAQLKSRLPAVTRVHPEFGEGAGRIGTLDLPSLDTLITQAAELEEGLPAPFCVYIHGDFNLDNIIYDPVEDRIHFIDVHRSRYQDFVQDVSVFMVSAYRLQIQDAATRARLADAAAAIHKTAENFARRRRDKTYHARLALGLARSFATSTRFVHYKSHACRMMLRARFLLERLCAMPEGKADRLRVPVEDLFRD